MNILELLNKAKKELKSKGILIDGFVNEFSDFQDVSLFFERINEHSNSLSDDLRNDLRSAYINYVNDVQGKKEVVYSDLGNDKNAGFDNNEFVNDCFKDDCLILQKKNNYKIQKNNKYANKNTKKMFFALSFALIVGASASAVTCFDNRNNEIETTAQITVQTTKDQTTQTTKNQKEYITMKYETMLGDNSEREIGRQLEISSSEIEIYSKYNMQAGETITLKIVDNEFNRSKVEAYNYEHASVFDDESKSFEESRDLYTFEFYVAPGEDIKDVCREAMNENSLLNRIYDGKAAELANAIIAQNPDKAESYFMYQAGNYSFDLSKSKAKVTQAMLDELGISLSAKNK